MATLQNTLDYTNDRLISWYKNAKLDYGVVGSGTAKIQDDKFIIDYVEDGETKTWSTTFYPEYLEFGIDYFYNVWMEQA